MNTQQGFPQTGNPFVDPNSGRIQQPWLQLLITLWNRTGGQQGDSVEPPVSVTASSGTTLSGDSLASPMILRSGPAAGFTDETDSAANYLASLGNAVAGTALGITLVNATAYSWTITPGDSVAFSGNTVGGDFIIPATSQRTFFIAINNVKNPSITIYG